MPLIPAVFRAPMWSRDDAVDRDAAVEWALRTGVVGVGGVLPIVPDDATKAALALTAVDQRLGGRLTRFVAMPAGSFVWTRGGRATWLGRVTGPWELDPSAAARGHDLPHVRPCRWLDDPVPLTEVPGAVLATFGRGGRNFQQIHDTGVGAATERVWADRVSL